jgi:hypothetical protein
MANELIFFVSSVVLLVLFVPLVSGSPIVQEACAAIRNPKFDSGSASCSGDRWGKDGKTCCWREQVPGQILADTYCQTCKNYKDANGITYEKCSDPVKQAIRLPSHESGPLGQGGVLEQQPTDKNVTSNQFKDRVDLGQLQELQEAGNERNNNTTIKNQENLK